jgi:hypothetical protein
MESTDKITKFFEDVKDAFEKAIGTSSSVDQERDERSVENYVRQSANTNSNYQIGGNIMENTTEPDPQGDIAITKVIDQVTRPEGDVSVSDAPEGPVPSQETIPSDATSSVAPSKTDEVATPDKVTITKSSTCPDCGGSILHECMGKADETKAEDSIEKSADESESKEEAAAETPADEKKEEVKKSLWGGAFAPTSNLK